MQRSLLPRALVLALVLLSRTSGGTMAAGAAQARAVRRAEVAAGHLSAPHLRALAASGPAPHVLVMTTASCAYRSMLTNFWLHWERLGRQGQVGVRRWAARREFRPRRSCTSALRGERPDSFTTYGAGAVHRRGPVHL